MFKYLLISLILSQTQSLAEDSAHILLGRGIVDKKTGDSIAVECKPLGSALTGGEIVCSEIQYVLFKNQDNTIVPLGSSIKLQDQTNDQIKEIQGILNSQQKKYIQLLKENKSYSKEGLYALGGAGLVAGVIAINPLTVIPVIMSTAGVATLVGASIFMAISSGDRGIKFKAKHMGRVYLDQSRWNWSISPKKIMHKSFQRFLGYLMSNGSKVEPSLIY